MAQKAIKKSFTKPKSTLKGNKSQLLKKGRKVIAPSYKKKDTREMVRKKLSASLNTRHEEMLAQKASSHASKLSLLKSLVTKPKEADNKKSKKKK